MLSFIQRYALLMSGVAVMALASPLSFAATTGGFDTPTGVQTMPIAVEGNAILTLTDNPSNAVTVDGKLQLSGWFGIGTTTPESPLDIVIPYYPSTPAIHTYAPSVFGNIWMGGDNDFAFDGGSDSYFWFTNTGAASGATAFLWKGQFNLFISNTGYVGIGTTAPQGNLDVENGQNTAKICLNGNCQQRLFDPNTCHIVTATPGAPPTYVSDARCAPNEFVLSGGGQAETPGSGICGNVSQGFIHYTAPDSDLQGWSVDAFSYDWSHDVCTKAYAVCCLRN